MSDFNEISVTKTMQQINGINKEVFQETHANAIVGLEDFVKQVAQGMAIEEVEEKMTSVPIMQLKGDAGNGEENVFLRAHVEGIVGLDEVLPREAVEITNWDTFDPRNIGLNLGQSISVWSTIGVPGAPWATDITVGTLTCMNAGTMFRVDLKRAAVASNFTNHMSREASRQFDAGEWSDWSIIASEPGLSRYVVTATGIDINTPGNQYPFGKSLFNVNSAAQGFPTAMGTVETTMVERNTRIFQFYYPNSTSALGSGNILYRSWHTGVQTPTNWTGWRSLNGQVVGTLQTGKKMDGCECNYYLKDKLEEQQIEIDQLKRQMAKLMEEASSND